MAGLRGQHHAEAELLKEGCPVREVLVHVEDNIHYPTPIMEQEAYQEWKGQVEHYPVTRRICAEEVSLPLYPGMTQGEINRVIACVNEF